MDLNNIRTLQMISVRWWNASAYYAVSLADALTQAGYYSYASGKQGSPPIQKAATDFQVPIFDAVDFESYNPFTLLNSYHKFSAFLTSKKPAILNAHRPEDHIFSVVYNAFNKTKIPVVRTVSDVRSPKDHSFNRALHNKTDFFIFSSQSSFERYQKVWPIFQDNSAIIHSGLNVDAFQPSIEPHALRCELGISENQLVIGIIARFDPVKNHQMFLEAAAVVAKGRDDVRFLISGESCNIQLSELITLATELGIKKNCLFLERGSKYLARDLISVLDIGVITSSGSEVICRVAAEYMAQGKPVVSTDVNVLPEMVDDGINGFVVENNHSKMLADRLSLLLEKEDIRKKMGEKARQYAEQRFSYSTLVEKTLQVYSHLLRSKQDMI